MMKKRILSGMRPTGKLHLGHLAGALENWVKLQNSYDCFFMVADWHALMSEYENSSLISEYSIDNVVDWLSVGIRPANSTIFIQSSIPEHLELYMMFSCLVPLSWVERIPTYKEQLRELKNREIHTYGFLGYPVLQAADILIYNADAVPVGQDQLPHLELTREISRRFNYIYKKQLFREPKDILTSFPKLLGIDGRKMSKSYNNTINLSDSVEEVRKKVLAMITDPKRIYKSDPGHPEICNVHTYYEVFFPDYSGEVSDYCRKAKVGCRDCKEDLARRINEKLMPIRKKREDLLCKKKKIIEIIESGNEKAGKTASSMMKKIKEIINLCPIR
ncbi:MAG: tryptophan--tRNA ligase [Candidatus Omnitrophica bacterium]|nr:tryptophan--tRNA ligase [Candidatus Omnitrophota bacterium]